MSLISFVMPLSSVYHFYFCYQVCLPSPEEEGDEAFFKIFKSCFWSGEIGLISQIMDGLCDSSEQFVTKFGGVVMGFSDIIVVLLLQWMI